MPARPPDFIGIGAQKAGTWWLRTNLARHPRIWMPPVRELHYFDRSLPDVPFPPAGAAARLGNPRRLQESLKLFQNDARATDPAVIAWRAIHEFLDHDDDWYRLLFSLAPQESFVGEITPRYAICRDAEIARMHAVAPQARLLLLLRHPVERFWAQCKMKHADGTLPVGDPAAMRLLDSANGRPRGAYTATIDRFANRYDPSQILLVFLDGIAREPHAVLRSVCEFIGLPDCLPEDSVVSAPVNPSADPSPMPETLRARVTAAYQAEIETMAEVFGGYAAGWLDGVPPTAAAATVRLESRHVEAIAARRARVRAQRTRMPGKIFCLSMQRSGTTSVGDWLESHGLNRAGSPTSVRTGWTRMWFEGRYDAIFETPEFQAAEILEDDPWWCPGFHRELASRFPDALFILLTRDPDEWFDSLCHHSGGMNPGWTDVHARIYDREADLRELLRANPGIDPASPSMLSIVGRGPHYKAMYERHIEEVRATFAATPERLFYGRLDDAGSFEALCGFVGVKRNPRLPIPRSNARTEGMRRALAARLAGGMS